MDLDFRALVLYYYWASESTYCITCTFSDIVLPPLILSINSNTPVRAPRFDVTNHLNERKEFMQETQHTQQTATQTAQNQDIEKT